MVAWVLISIKCFTGASIIVSADKMCDKDNIGSNKNDIRTAMLIMCHSVFIGNVNGSEENWRPRSNNCSSVKENVSVRGWTRSEWNGSGTSKLLINILKCH